MDKANLIESGYSQDLSDLMVNLCKLYSEQKWDGYCLYSYGILLKKLNHEDLAISVLIESITKVPTL